MGGARASHLAGMSLSSTPGACGARPATQAATSAARASHRTPEGLRMAGPADLSDDLRRGLLAVDEGEVDPGRFVAALRAWAETPDRPLSEVLTERGVLGAPAGPPPDGAADVASDVDATVAYVRSTPTVLSLTPGGPSQADRGRDGHRFQIVRPHA